MGLSPLTDVTQNLGKYSLIEKIGDGHLGAVYRGFNQDLGTPVVVRILSDGIKWDPKIESVYAQETCALTALQHPNIAAVLDIGIEGSSRYIAMESLGSGTLKSLIAQNSSIPVETKLSIMIHISEGLSYAHKHGILHRDLAPGNIHLAPDGSAKIRDFALAHILAKYLPHPLVRYGAPIYLCPEQIQHQQCDERSDIFSAGTIFYELLTHAHPFHDRDSNKALDNILSDAPIATFEKFPEAPPGIWAILRNCLAKDPGDRYRSADELSEACRELLVSLAEDKQLILSELYASLSSLKKAAAQPNASASTIILLRDVQTLLRGEKEADYISLDGLMTRLTQEFPVIQAAACEPPDLNSLCPQVQPEASESELEPDRSDSLNKALESAMESMQGSAHANSQRKTVDEPAWSQAKREDPMETPIKPKNESSELNECATFAQAKDEYSQAVEGSLAISPELVSTLAESDYVPLPPSASRFLKMRRPSYRTAVVLLSILVIAAAGYIAVGSEASSSLQKAWDGLISIFH